MTEQKVSPFTGRPVIEWIDDEIELHDTDGDEIGNVVEVNPDFIVTYANTGFLGLGEPRGYYIPRDNISRMDDDDWFLNIDQDQIEAMSWRIPPDASPWSDEWTQEQLAYDLHPWRGQTRVRRYEDIDTTDAER
jgi:hypothetical protein